ncbi:MAG: class I SAM-dependent RNA methyltransferase [Bacilli bacterium]|nr:class I SAM-dependent RNA methyltransferase [Bacilli bacterium]
MEVTIEKLDNFGRGITYIDEKIVFVENALPGEIVDIEIINEKKKYKEAQVLKIIKKSNDRIKPLCPYSNECGGCDLNHLDYSKENEFKYTKVKELVKKYLNEDIEIKEISFSKENTYRNKIVLHGKSKVLGQYKKHSNEIIPINKCLLVNDKINEIIEQVKEDNIEEVTIKTSNDLTNILVDIKGEITNHDKLLNIANVLIVNNKLLSNDKSIISPINDKKYYVSSKSFFQVNRFLTSSLYDEVRNTVKKIKPNRVLDLYCGTGTIGIYISDYCKEIIGIDYNKSNIEDANKNIELNKCNNIKFICDKVENRIEAFKDIDLIVVDPPRSGLDAHTREILKELDSKTIIYVSCDIMTLMRDLKDLNTSYNINYIKPFNMFPRTYHVECVCVLNSK